MSDKPAIEGGKPVRGDFLVFGSPMIEEPEINEVLSTIKSGWLGTGPKTHKFEEMFKEYKFLHCCITSCLSCFWS